jgi:hypothetical protein
MVFSTIEKYDGKLYPSHSESLVREGSNDSLSGHSAAELDPNGNIDHNILINHANSNFISNNPVEAKLFIAMVLAIISGLIHVSFKI